MSQEVNDSVFQPLTTLAVLPHRSADALMRFAIDIETNRLSASDVVANEEERGLTHPPEIKSVPIANERLRLEQTVKAMTSSKSNEWYTPTQYIEAVRNVLGTIDLDPASCAVANTVVQAERFYTEADDGLRQKWYGRVFLNPPYAGLAPKFADRLLKEYTCGNVEGAIMLLNSHATDAKWFQPLFDYVLCFTNHRSKFWNTSNPEGSITSPTHGSVFVYLGRGPSVFAEHFKRFGAILNRYRDTYNAEPNGTTSE